MATRNYLAFDLGAESGRAFLGRFDGEQLSIEEIHRFANEPVRVGSALHWDVLRLFHEMKQGMRKARALSQDSITSVGVDTWGVDYGLFDSDGQLLGNPYHYRDARTDTMMDVAFSRVPRDEIFRRTGIQFMQLNTLYQLLAESQLQTPRLEMADHLLLMPDLFNYWLTGVKVSEFSIATTTQFYNPVAQEWARDLLADLGLPAHFLPEIVPTGTVLGEMQAAVAEEVGLSSVQVVAPACHDTGSAVAAVPAQASHFAYLSSGTWSLLGTELRAPLINEQSLANNFTNEGGVDGTIRFLQNISGLWLLQECRRNWEAQTGHRYSYAELTDLALEARPFGAVLDPNDGRFLHPGDMPARISEFCRQTGQTPPQSRGEFVRCILESLALRYRFSLERMDAMLGRRLEPLHIVGGGSQNQLLCQWTADATTRAVVAGPVEATAIGNLLVQAMAQGHISHLADLRAIVRNSFPVQQYSPTAENKDAWDESYQRFTQILEHAL